MKKPKIIAISIVLCFVVFLGITLVTKLFSGADLPLQITGAFLGAVVSALMTYFLLAGQTRSEENKERNVKVFEKKAEVFNNFIEQLWLVWEDRSVTLEEIYELLKLVSKDIIPYAKPDSSEKILKELNAIADFANPDKSDSANNDTTQQIQKSVFAIINILSKEIGLGGEIKPEISSQLNDLEHKVIPALNRKTYLKILDEQIEKSGGYGKFIWEADPRYGGSVLWSELKNGMWLRVGDVRNESTPTYITFWSGNRQFASYRCAQKGNDREWMKNYYPTEDGETEFLKQFKFEAIRNGDNLDSESVKKLAAIIGKFIEEWKSEADGKTIQEIINF
jgi:hypothetical protein